MMVRSSTVKPQKVNAWARPGTVHLRSRRWPPTSVISTSARFAHFESRPGAGWPAVTRRPRNTSRRPATRNAMAVAASAMGYLVSTSPPEGWLLMRLRRAQRGWPRDRPRLRNLFPVSDRSEILEVPARCRTPLSLVLRPRLPGAVGMLGRGGHAEETDLADLHPQVQGDGKVGNV